MAARGIALGRIIDWARNADTEEVRYAHTRFADILRDRQGQVARADAAGQVKRTRRANAKPQQPAPVAPISQAAGE